MTRLKRMATWCVLLAALVSPVWGDDAKPDPVGDARTQWLKGKYDDARAALVKVLEAEPANDRAVGILASLDMELGRFEDAGKRCEEFLRASPKASNVRVQLAWSLYERGELDKAYAEARKVELLDPKDLNARYLEALIQYQRGQHPMAKRVFETFIDAWQETPEDKMTAEDAVVIGEGCTWFALADRNPAMLKTIVNKVYPLALRKDPLYTPAMVASGMLFLEKYNTGQAMKEFDSALRVNPNLPAALVGMARCLMDDHKYPEAHDLLEKASAVAPNLPDVLLLDATLSTYDEDYEAALATVEKVLAVNPSHQEALGMKGACFFELDRKDDYAAVEKKALEVNPKCAVFYQAVADVLITRHRDAEAGTLLRKAMELAPDDSAPAATLGQVLMRLGEEKQAYEVLDKAYAMDSFNFIVVNTLNLLDKMKDFEVKKTEHFTVKISPKADRMLAEYVPEYLEKIYPEVTAHYGFKIPQTLIEIFPDHRMFSVRTSGVPNIGTVGACLGPMIAMDSPSVARPGSFNWEDTLRHEFTHAVTLTGTDMRISHWFTEALAVSEERRPFRYEWYQLLVDALARNELMPVAKLNYGFTRARTQERRQLAYAEAYLIGDFVRKTYGPEKIIDMMAHYKKGESTEQMVLSVFGMKADAFDAKFREFAVKLAQDSKLRPAPQARDQAEIEKKIAESPKDAELRLELARIKLGRGDQTGAAVAVLEALKLNPASARAHAALGAVRLAEKNVEAARSEFKQAIALNPNEIGAVRGMLQLAQMDKNDADMLAWAGALQKAEPLNPGLYKMQAQLFQKKKDVPNAVEALKKAADLDSQDYGSRRELVQLMIERADYASAADYADQAIGIWPYEKQLHEWAATAFEKLGKKDRADREKAVVAMAVPAPAPAPKVDVLKPDAPKPDAAKPDDKGAGPAAK